MRVIAADGLSPGIVREIWTDRGEPQIRYMEVELTSGDAGPVLLPMGFARIDTRRGTVRVKALLARHFADVPRTASPDVITKREEDKITGYFAGGHLYATPARLGPVL
jgi:photosynthetic reaction center H subunit